MRTRLSIAALAVLAQAMLVSSASATPPQQLHNKTIVISWSVTVVHVDEDGERGTANVSASHTIFVSTAGRLFHRGARESGMGRKHSHNAPGATQNAHGEVTSVRFSGAQLIGSTAFAGGARQFVATFDSTFSSCRLSVTFGRAAGGTMKRRGIDGEMRTIESMTASGESCSIRDGNAFAN